jgi:dTMP kinase
MEGSRGILIGIEGVDAVGKKTQSSLLASWLTSKNIVTHTMSFPDYGTIIGREIKNYLLGNRDYSTEVGHMLYAINRWEKRDEIKRLLADSDVLIVNRYSASNFAYGVAKGLKLDWLMNLEEGLPKADLVLVLDAPPSTLVSRRGPKDKYERSIELQEEVRGVYLKLSKQLGWTVINAAQGIESTNRVLVAAVSKALAAKGLVEGSGPL